MPRGPFDKDLTDAPLPQMVVGGICGYLAGGAKDSEAVLLSSAAVVAWRTLHYMGFLEFNLWRRRQHRHRRRRPDSPRVSFFDENKALLTGLAGGYAAARVRANL